ncbi:MAG: ABC transporter permease [Alphaproteobacteria bacterium]
MADITADATGRATSGSPMRAAMARALRRHPMMIAGGVVLVLIAVVSAAAPLLAPHDPIELNVVDRLRPPGDDYVLGTDAYGRDMLSRLLYGGRVSLAVGLAVAALSTLIGLVIGVVAGYYRLADAIIMRVMDGLMAIPGILLAIALMALTRASVGVVILAITVPEIPRVVRLVRAVVLSIREQTYVQAAVAIGTRFPRLMRRHILPNTVAPLVVQATYIFAQAVLIEAYLSFLGVGTPPEIPSWGNIIAEGRIYVQIAYWQVLFPGIAIALMVLSINVLGDGLRDILDPRLARRI